MCSRVSVKCVCVWVCIWCASNLWIEFIHRRPSARYVDCSLSITILFGILFSLSYFRRLLCFVSLFSLFLCLSHIVGIVFSLQAIYFYPSVKPNHATIMFEYRWNTHFRANVRGCVCLHSQIDSFFSFRFSYWIFPTHLRSLSTISLYTVMYTFIAVLFLSCENVG